MSILTANFYIAAEQNTGFGAQQVLFDRGFYMLGKRKDAAAFTIPDEEADVDAVIRISRDGEGSKAYFDLAQELRGNPYMPVVMDHKMLPSGDHIALVEKLENPAMEPHYSRFRKIENALAQGLQTSADDVGWFEEMKYAALMSSSFRHFFSTTKFYMDIDSLPEPEAFREAATAVVELSTKMNKENHAYVPSPDLHERNILWRRVESGLFPVLYDSVSKLRSNYGAEENMAGILRQRLGMPALEHKPF